MELYQKYLLLGKYIEINRIDNEFTLDSLSKLIGISKGYLSEIENGKKNPRKNIVHKILEILNSDFNYDEIHFTEGIEQLSNAYKAYMQEDYLSLKSIFDKSDYLINTFGFPSYMLIGLICKLANQKEVIHDIKHISMIEDCFNDVQKSIWLELQINVSINLFEIKQANTLLDSLKKVCVSLVYPMYYLDKMIVSIYQFDRLNALIYYHEAINSFSKECNNQKLLHLFAYKLAIYSEFNKQEEFEELFIKLMSKAEINKTENLKLACLKIKISNDIKFKNFNDVIDIIEKTQKKHKSFMLSSLAYSYYRTNDIKKLKKTIAIINDYGNEYDILFSKFMEAIINGNDKLIIKERINALIDINMKKESFSLLVDSILIFIDYYLTVEDYKSIYELTSKYLLFK